MDFLSIALQCSFLPVTVGMTPDADFGAPGWVLQSGYGEPSKSGDKVTLDYWIQDESGKEIANSGRRGLPQSFDLLTNPGDSLLNGAALGARAGEERLMILFAEDWHEEISPLSLVRNPGLLIVRLKVSRVDRR